MTRRTLPGSLHAGFYAAQNLKAGDQLMIEDVIELRPSAKRDISKLTEMVGKTITNNVRKGEQQQHLCSSFILLMNDDR